MLEYVRNEVHAQEFDLISAGVLKLGCGVREFGDNGGLTIHVFEAEDTQIEVLRFDCFRVEPHYHHGFSYLDLPYVSIPAMSVEAAVDWALAKLRKDIISLLKDSRRTDLAVQISAPEWEAAWQKLRLKAQLTPVKATTLAPELR